MLKLKRSRLVMPANNMKFIDKAPLRNADIIVLDLEDSVPSSQKLLARRDLKKKIEIANQGGSSIYVRVNNNTQLLKEDIDASISPPLTGIYVPKIEKAEQVVEIDELLSAYEKKLQLSDGHFKISILIETAKGLLNLNSILCSSKRIDTVSLGAEDFAKDVDLIMGESTKIALLNIRMQICIAAHAFGVLPMGLMSSIADFTNLEEVESSALLAYEHGFVGTSCIHPSNVEVLNKAFSPSEKSISEAHELIKVFDEAQQNGKSAIRFKEKMVDIPHYEQAKNLISTYEQILQYEQYKEICRKSYIGGQNI
ncbi:CoA ester lyase [Psychrobacillus sp. FJAT-51614]|uniref:CoA ester lyase n=1 Tax=Psychrobacillus mangrovi TaxID=3117745 RepID=A0ABU8F9Y8_9BACI